MTKEETLQNLRQAWNSTVHSVYASRHPRYVLNFSFSIIDNKKIEWLIIDEKGTPWYEMTINLDIDDPLYEIQHKLRNLGCCFKLTASALKKKYPQMYTNEINDSIIEECLWFCKNFYFAISNVRGDY